MDDKNGEGRIIRVPKLTKDAAGTIIGNGQTVSVARRIGCHANLWSGTFQDGKVTQHDGTVIASSPCDQNEVFIDPIAATKAHAENMRRAIVACEDLTITA